MPIPLAADLNAQIAAEEAAKKRLAKAAVEKAKTEEDAAVLARAEAEKKAGSVKKADPPPAARPGIVPDLNEALKPQTGQVPGSLAIDAYSPKPADPNRPPALLGDLNAAFDAAEADARAKSQQAAQAPQELAKAARKVGSLR
jgi:hypothetical protein